MNFHLIYPEFLLIGLAFLVLMLDFFLSEKKKYLLNWVSTLGMAFILGIALFMNQQGDLYQGLLIIDGYASFFRIFFTRSSCSVRFLFQACMICVFELVGLWVRPRSVQLQGVQHFQT